VDDARAGPPERGYMIQLDALRCFAVLGVIVSHNWRPRLPGILVELDFGDLGVRLFFVLSGFLITGILLRAAHAARSGRERGGAMRSFYIRRFLRIFPLYYLVLVVTLVLAVAPVRELWPWLFTYTLNVHIWHDLSQVENVGHFWTLAVEEQFYVLWPFVVLFAARRHLAPLLVGLCALAVAYRLYASFRWPQDVAGDLDSMTLILGVIDSLALGALLALALDRDPLGARVRPVLTRVALPVGAVVFVVTLVLRYIHPASHVSVAFADTGTALVFCWLVGCASLGFRGRAGRLLELAPLTYLGRISYGMYVLHNLIPVALAALAVRVGIGYHDWGAPNFVVSGLLTIALAALSWHFFEAPINRLKRRFRYTPAAPAPPDGATTVAP
jgi:peptidoglycan/LPS O-acetylase OafA/YrhL